MHTRESKKKYPHIELYICYGESAIIFYLPSYIEIPKIRLFYNLYLRFWFSLYDIKRKKDGCIEKLQFSKDKLR